MCHLTPLRYLCADPFGYHPCGNGYIFLPDRPCATRARCTKFYASPINMGRLCEACHDDALETRRHICLLPMVEEGCSCAGEKGESGRQCRRSGVGKRRWRRL